MSRPSDPADPADGAGLEGVTDLTPDDAVRVAQQVGGQLADLHAHGSAHGGVAPSAITRAFDGYRLGPPTHRDGAPADDVLALARTVAGLMGGVQNAPEHLRRALFTAMSPDPLGRPSVPALLFLLADAAPRAPVGPPPLPFAPQRRVPWVAGLTALVLVGVGALVVARARSGPDVATFRIDAYVTDTLDPALVEGGTGFLVAGSLFTTLLVLGTDGQPTTTGGAASAYGHDAACTTWTFHVRPGRFSNGEAADAAAFAKGITRTVATSEDPSFGLGGIVGSDAAGERAADGDAQPDTEPTLSGLVTPDAQTLVVHLSGPDCRFQRALALPAASPAASTPFRDADGDELPVGNGPFRLAHRWSYADRSLTLLRNDGWDYGPRPALARVELQLSTRDEDGAGVRAGRADLATVGYDLRPGAPRPTAAPAPPPGGTVLVDRSDGLLYLAVQGSVGTPLADPRARLAISAALDREVVVAATLPGRAVPATSLFPPELPLYSQPGVCPTCFRADPAAARELAAQAGLVPGTRIPLSGLSLTTDAWFPVVAQQLRDVLGVELVAAPNGDGQSPDGLVLGTAYGIPLSYELADPAFDTALAVDSAAPGRYHDEQVHALLAQASATEDEQARASLVRRAEAIAVGRDLAVVPLWFATRSTVVATSRFADVRTDVFGNPVLAQIRPAGRAG